MHKLNLLIFFLILNSCNYPEIARDELIYENDFEIREQKSMEHFQKESNKPENVQRFINLGNVDEAKERMAAGLPEDENIGPNN